MKLSDIFDIDYGLSKLDNLSDIYSWTFFLGFSAIADLKAGQNGSILIKNESFAKIHI